MKILLIDDEESIRDGFGAYLKTFGHDVISAADGKAGIQILSQNPDREVVVTDLNMPGLDGVDVIKHVVANHPGIKIILMSGNMTPMMEKAVKEIGASAACGKSSLHDLMNLIEGN